MALPYRHVTLDGARIAYQVTGSGPAIVVIKNNRRPPDYGAVPLLAHSFSVFQVHPVGFGASDRPGRFEFGDIAQQLLAVMDQEEVGRFVVWGFSQGAAMAVMAARATARAAAVVAGGFPLIGVPTDGVIRRMEREPRIPRASLEFWRAYRRLDWATELRALDCPKLTYIGTEDPARKTMRRVSGVLRYCGCDYVELEGLNHVTGGLGDCSNAGVATTRAVTRWLAETLPGSW